MADTPPEETDDTFEEPTDETDLAGGPVTSPCKVVGDFADGNDGIGVLGRNTAGTGRTRGVEGRVDSPLGYGLATPDDAKIDGELFTDTEFTVNVDGREVIEHDPDSTSGYGGTVIMGHSSNFAADGISLPEGATI